MQAMYAGVTNSPGAVLNNDVNAAATIIPVSDVAVFPAAPNRATIGTDENAETILYAAKTADALSGCTRGVEGTAQPWTAGTPIARYFTNGDYAALAGNITELTGDMDAHTANTTNPHSVTKSQVGLGNVDNTSDADKPVSDAAAAALAAKAPLALSAGFAPAEYLINPVAGDSVETALGKLDAFSYRLYQFQFAGSSNFTWIKLFSTNINNLTSESSNSVSAVEFDIIGSAHPNMGSQMSGFMSIQRFGTAGVHTIRRKLFYPYQYDTNQSGTAFTDVGYVLDKTNETWRFEVWIRCGKYADRFLARASFNNTRAVYPDVSTRTTTEPTGIVYVEPTTYAPTDSPTFTGTPTVPTAAAGTNTTQAASTAFVNTAVAGKAPTASPAFTGTPTAPSADLGSYTLQVANTYYVQREIYDVNVSLTRLNDETTWLSDCVERLAQQAGISLPGYLETTLPPPPAAPDA